MLLTKYYLRILIVLQIIAGIFVGFTACGGYIWVENSYFYGVLTLGIIFSVLLFWNKRKLSIVYRIIFSILTIIITLGTGILSYAIGNAFYSDYPKSFQDLIIRILNVIQNGAC